MAHGTPTLATGKICYLEIPAADVDVSSRFYRDAFGWELRTRGDGAIAFDDAVKEVSGSWVTGRPPSAEPGIMVHIMVADLDAALAAVRSAGGDVLNDDAAPGERVGHVRDPGGNVIGIYQEPGLAERERTVGPVPEHLHTVTPRLALSDAAAGIDFYKAAFDATELGERYHMPDGTLVHAELLIGDSVVMVKDAQDDEFNALLCTYWPDVDAAWDRAVRAGAEVVYPLADQFYGERGGRLGDPFGNQWMLASRIETLTPAEVAAREPE
jgi:PhnB protein